MENNHIKVAVLYNESNPDIYLRETALPENLDFTPYFDIHNYNPVEEYQLLADKMKNLGYDSYALNVKDDLNLLLDNLLTEKPDMVFNFIELFKEDPRLEMNICGLFELLDIPYTGASPLGLANCQSKFLTKKILSAIGVKIPDNFFVASLPFSIPDRMKYPMIVKPAYEDGSVGIENDSIVFNEQELRKRVEYVVSYFNQPALIDEYIDGRELNVAVYGDLDPVVLPVSEIDFSNMPEKYHHIVSFQAKWEASHETYHKTIPICPAELPKETEEKVKVIALKAFRAMEVRDYSRIDMRLTPDGEIYVLEVNPNPDLTEGVGFARSAAAAGYSYDDVLDGIIKFALARKKIKAERLQK
jgi:D-alanine-D-alanine ligase